MNTITYTELKKDNFNRNSLDKFIRHQEVKECWRQVNGEWTIVPNVFNEDWDIFKCREIAGNIEKRLTKDWIAFGAFLQKEIIGFIVISKNTFGSRNQYMELILFHVSQPFRSHGIGRQLMSKASIKAKTMGAEKLYISAHSSKESQAAYRKLGCKLAQEINKSIAEDEPFDVQMEYIL